MRFLTQFAALAIALVAGGIWAQIPAPTPAPAKQEAEDPLGRSSPHGSMKGFLKAAASQDYARAAQYLNIRNGDPQDLARQLHMVMDAGLHDRLEDISREHEGDLGDGLAQNREKVGAVDLPAMKFPVEMDRVERDGAEVWLFSPRTLRQIPRAFATMEPPAIVNNVPPFLRDTKLFDIPLWRWLLEFGIVVAAWVLATILAKMLIGLVSAGVRRFTHKSILNPNRLRGPLRLILLAAGFDFLSSYAGTVLARTVGANIAGALIIAGIAWLIARICDIATDFQCERLAEQQRTGQITVLAMGRRLFKVLIWFFAGVLLLDRAGVNVTALFAGLGLGGVAVALAARRTIENMFGGISLITREAMRVGDTCQVNGQTGVVEDIGLGTTRLRTSSRTVISLPNAELAQASLENFSMRDKFLLSQTIELRPETTQQQLADSLAAITAILKNNPKVEPATWHARFVGFNPTSLRLEVFAYILDASFAGYLATQETILMQVLAAIEASGASVSRRTDQPHRLAKDLEKLAESHI